MAASSAPRARILRQRVRSACRCTGNGSSRSRSPACSRGSPAGSTCICCRSARSRFYLDLTFITLAMLVIGGMTSLWGAVIGALAVSGLDSLLAEAENGLDIGGYTIDLPAGTRLVVVGTLMALMLILRPSGITGGRELRLDHFRRTRPPSRKRTPRENLHRRLRRSQFIVCRQPRHPRRRRCVGIRPLPGPR